MEGEDGKVGGGVALSCLGGLEELGVVVVVVVSPRRARAQARSARKCNGIQRLLGWGRGSGLGGRGLRPAWRRVKKRCGREGEAHRRTGPAWAKKEERGTAPGCCCFKLGGRRGAG